MLTAVLTWHLHHVGVRWCTPRVEELKSMRPKQNRSTPMKTSDATRASVTFPRDLYRALEELARQKKVSVAWIVRDAAEKYAAEQRPSLTARPGKD